MDDSILEAEGPLDEFHPGNDDLEVNTREVPRPGTSSDVSESGPLSTGADGGSPMNVDL